MRAVVDKDACIGCGLCIATEPEVFEDVYKRQVQGI